MNIRILLSVFLLVLAYDSSAMMPGKKRAVVIHADSDTESDSDSGSEERDIKKSLRNRKVPVVQIITNDTKSVPLLNYYSNNSLKQAVLGILPAPNYIHEISLKKPLVIAVQSQVFEILYEDKTNSILIKLFTGKGNNDKIVINKIDNPFSGKVAIEISNQNPHELIHIKPVSN